MSLKTRARHLLFNRPEYAEASIYKRVFQTFFGPSDQDIKKILSPICKSLNSQSFLIDANGDIRAGQPTNHQQMALLEYDIQSIMHATLGKNGFLLFGNHPLKKKPHIALAWKTPGGDHLVGQIAHSEISEWRGDILNVPKFVGIAFPLS